MKLPYGFSFGRRGPRAAELAAQGQPDPKAAGLPNVLNARSALSAAVLIANGISGSSASEVNLLANWDAREDFTADRANRVEHPAAGPSGLMTRTAISEHTYANGFNENVYYYGDAAGNFWIGTDASPGTNNSPNGSVDGRLQINLPQLVNSTASGGVTLLNPTSGDCSDTTSTITGIAVNPVADLADFGAAYCGVIGEVVYVSALESSGCASNAAGQPIRTRIFAFGFADTAGGVMPVGAFQIQRNPLGGSAGLAVDDDGSLYFHLSNPSNPSAGGAIFKAAELSRTVTACAPNNPRINRVITNMPVVNLTSVTPLSTAGVKLTNYSGTATTFGNIVALAAGSGNVVYAALARSLNAADDGATKATEGPFTNPAALGPTPSMVISFADTGGTIGFTGAATGAFDACSSPNMGTVAGALPIGDGFADQAQAGQTRTVGVNNFRVFVMGNGPDIRNDESPLGATAANTLPNLDLQIDYSIFAGLTVDEEGTVYVVSGGAPSGGLNPSPSRGEILAFPDQNAKDRRADYIDLRGDAPPNPPASGGNVGDGDSDRFDHIYWVAPLDGVTNTPLAVAGISRGFLLYTNRTRDRNTGTLANLPNGGTQSDDGSAGPLVFEDFDGGHQVAGGDDQNTPFRGDDNDGAGNAAVPGALNGGFEYNFGGPVGTANAIWNSFFLNANGNLTFGAGDTDNTSSEAEFRSGLPKVAAAWSDINPEGRPANFSTFPVQALGFSDVNAFKVRWINVPEFQSEACGSRNTFAITLYDDGTGIDENANQPLNPANPIGNNAVPYDLQEGPTDLRFLREPNSQLLVQSAPRREGTGYFCLEYGRMDLLGAAANPVLAGYSMGNQNPDNPPGLCELNLGAAAVMADASPFNRGLIGSGTEPTVFEFFNSGTPPSAPSTVGVPDFDLRFEGNDPAIGTAASQPDPNEGHLCFYGIAAGPPPNPTILQVTPTNPLALPPGQTGLINSLCEVSLDITGAGFYPNEETTICEGGSSRSGKTVTTGITLRFDANGNGVPEVTLTLENVTPISSNLVRATIAKLNDFPGTAFPFEVLGGGGTTLVLTTTQTAGDNNAFGPFTRTNAAAVPVATVGKRAPIVLSVSPVSGNPAGPQMLTITGADFRDVANANTVTSVFAVEQGNPGNVIQAASFTVQSATQVDATFDFMGLPNAGKTFLIFVSGPNGTSRNLLPPPPAGTPEGCVLGNEAGNVVTFTTNACVTSLTPAGQSFTAAGGGGSIAVTATTGCGWTAVSNAAFIHVTSGSPGNGDGTAGFTVDANPGLARSGTITIGELTFTVNQDTGCSFMIMPASQNAPASGGNGSVSVIASDAACPWTAASNDTWITITAGSAGTGNGTVNYTVANNTGPGRSGTMTIAGQTFTVTQTSGCPALIFAAGLLPNGALNVPYNQTISVLNGQPPHTFAVTTGSLPNGVMLSPGGALSGTPAQAGVFNFTVIATDANGCTGTNNYSLAICGPITVNPASLPNGFAGTAYNQTFTATGGTAPYTFTQSAGSLPDGLSLTGGSLSGTPSAAGTFNFTIQATDASGCTGTRAYTVIVSGAGLMFYPLAHPVRLLDTRAGQTGCDAPGVPIAGGTSRTQTAAGRTCNGLTIPANAKALAGNITTVESGGGYLTLYPSDIAQPMVANSNYAPNEVLNNVFTVGLGAGDGAFKIFVTSTTNVVVDVTGYYAPPGAGGLYFHPLPKPVRLLETRSGFTGCTAPSTPLPGNAETTQQARGLCDGVTIPTTALAIAGNATTVNPQGAGAQFLTLYPANASQPLAASSNYLPGQTMNAPFTAGLSSTGEFKIFPTSQTDLVIDVLGYYSPEANDVNGAGLLFTPLPKPVRLLETRAGFTGCFGTGTPLLAGSTRTQSARGLCDGETVAANALGIVGNATVVLPQSGGYLTFWPSGGAQPMAAASNFTAGQALNRHFTVGLRSSDGAFNIFTSATTDLVIDVSGFFAP